MSCNLLPYTLKLRAKVIKKPITGGGSFFNQVAVQIPKHCFLEECFSFKCRRKDKFVSCGLDRVSQMLWFPESKWYFTRLGMKNRDGKNVKGEVVKGEKA